MKTRKSSLMKCTVGKFVFFIRNFYSYPILRYYSTEYVEEHQRKEEEKLRERKGASIPGVKGARMPGLSPAEIVIKNRDLSSPESVRMVRQERSVKMGASDAESIIDEIPVETERREGNKVEAEVLVDERSVETERREENKPEVEVSVTVTTSVTEKTDANRGSAQDAETESEKSIRRTQKAVKKLSDEEGGWTCKNGPLTKAM